MRFSGSCTVLTCAGLLALAVSWHSTSGGSRVAAQSPSVGSSLDPAILGAYKWRSIGPARKGRSIAVSGVKGRKNDGCFGAVGGGLWKPSDRGQNWAPITDGQLRSGSVGAVAVSDSNPDIVFIGMGESCIRGNIQPGDGVYKSTDAGKTWTTIGFADSDAIAKIRIHPTNPDIDFVASFGRCSRPSTGWRRSSGCSRSARSKDPDPGLCSQAGAEGDSAVDQRRK